MRVTVAEELTYLSKFKKKSIILSTTAKHSTPFMVLPRRSYEDHGIISFQVNSVELFDDLIEQVGNKVDTIFIDVERKQAINLHQLIQNRKLTAEIITVKPNDNTVESADLLIRHLFLDSLIDKEVLVIGTGNIASKVSLRLAERQAQLDILGRTEENLELLINAINLILPTHNERVTPFSLEKEKVYHLIVSAISGQLNEDTKLLNFINSETIILDIGINNFSTKFISEALKQGATFLRLDTRISLPYQFINNTDYVKDFLSNVMGKINEQSITYVSGGIVGAQGDIVLDRLNTPTQVIGVADGSGGIKGNEELSEKDKRNLSIAEAKIK